jgi:TPR repeat protein
MEALRDYKTVVDAGYTEAMVDLGALYYLGHGVVQSYPTAFDYFSKASAAGSIRAMANLASMYGDGRGVPKDDAKSLDLAEKAVITSMAPGYRATIRWPHNICSRPQTSAMANR